MGGKVTYVRLCTQGAAPHKPLAGLLIDKLKQFEVACDRLRLRGKRGAHARF